MSAESQNYLRSYLATQKSSDAAVRAVLRQIGSDSVRELDALEDSMRTGALVRRAQVHATQEALGRIATDGWGKLIPIITDHASEAAAKLESLSVSSLGDALSKVPAAYRRAIMNGTRFAAEDAIKRAVRRYEGAGRIELSKRVYKNAALTSGRVDQIINSALGRGVTARNLAREVRQYILPSTPGGMSYAAMRLSRTEINNSFHAASIETEEALPFVEGVRWNISGSHPRPDLCDSFAKEDHAGLGNGVFDSGKVPGKPHPQCLCNITPIVPTQQEFVKAFMSGKYDSWLDKVT